MAKTIAVGNQKGGVGKSTVTMLAATALAAPPFNYRVAVVDLDRQQSIARRRSMDREDHTDPLPYDVLTYNLATFQREVNRIDSTYQIVFLDVPGKLDSEAGRDSEAVRVLQYIDLLLIPFTPGNFALAATLDYLKAALAVKAQRAALDTPERLDVVAFRNMHRVRSRHGRTLAGELDALTTLTAVPIMESPLKLYSEFEDADTLTSLYNPGSKNPARGNLSAWVDELHTLIVK